MAGVVAITVSVLPDLLADVEPTVPLWLVSLISIAQSAAYLGLAVWAGVVLAPRVGLGAPALEAALAGKRSGPALRRQLTSGAAGGLIGAILLQGAWLLQPDGFAEVAERVDVPLLARVLYGGITEELLIRWGLMTALLWVLWTLAQRRGGLPGPFLAFAAIALSAVPFGVGHLPLVAATVDGLTTSIVVWVVAANALFGVLAGGLYWRFGLESAVIAHALAHVFDRLAALAIPA